jgi:drug/metabolite transporter (DMT)-like permease
MDKAWIGETAALVAAFVWAVSTLMFGRLGQQLAPLVLNVAKGVWAIAFILITLAAQSLLFSDPALPNPTAPNPTLPNIPLGAVFALLMSGALGIGLGDTAYFAAINSLGPRRALLLETLAPAIAAVLAWIFLAERLSFAAIFGIVLTLGGIAWVISERSPDLATSQQKKGLKIGLLAALCQATGAVLSRAALANTTVDPLWSTLLRLAAGLASLALLAALQPQLLGKAQPSEVTSSSPATFNQTADRTLPGQTRTFKTRWQQSWIALKQPSTIFSVAIVAFFATYLGIWLQQIALKYTATGIAQALLATSPLFVLPMAAALGDRINTRAILGVVIALVGLWILLID